jgi:hypothetical protein
MVSKRENFTAAVMLPHALTVILEIDAHIFGAFTPVEWASPRNWKEKTDPSLKSFFFTLKDLQNVPVCRFVDVPRPPLSKPLKNAFLTGPALLSWLLFSQGKGSLSRETCSIKSMVRMCHCI